jgi:hypothetical protein
VYLLGCEKYYLSVHGMSTIEVPKAVFSYKKGNKQDVIIIVKIYVPCGSRVILVFAQKAGLL